MIRFPLAVLALFLFAVLLYPASDPRFFPLEDVRAGQHGIGKTVFSGSQVEEFQVEILGVLPNAGPKESVILARLSGGPLDHTGVMQGMSGSPVYIDGKLLGAVAMAFPFSKDPIAAIRPIGDMIRAMAPAQPITGQRLNTIARAMERGRFGPEAEANAAGDGASRLINISTPLALGGFTERAIHAFAPQMRSLGLEPRQALSAGGSTDANASLGDPSRIQPGSMISVQLMTGDMNVGADGTVTYVDGDRLFAFGHRFLDVGSTSIPFARSEVLTLLANVNTSFKISAPKEMMGVISQDRDTSVVGRFGERAHMVPLAITVKRGMETVDRYQMEMVDDPALTPMLVQMAVFSAVDATERTQGPLTVALAGTVDLTNHRSIRLNDVYSADALAPQAASLATATPVAYVLQSGFSSLDLERIDLTLNVSEVKRTADIEDVVPSVIEARPGQLVTLAIHFTTDGGGDLTRNANFQIPAGAEPGPLFFTVADGLQTSIQDLRFALNQDPRTPEQLLSLIGKLRDNDQAYVRIWRPETSYPAGLSELPAPPPSVALVMATTLGPTVTALQAAKNSKVAEITIGGIGRMVTGSKTVQIEVKP